MNSIEVFRLIETIAAEPGKKAKEALIAQHGADELLRRTLVAALSPLVSYGVSKMPDRQGKGSDAFDAATWDLIDALAKRKLTGHAARDAIQAEVDRLGAESAQLLTRILRKNLKAGFSESTVNKAIKNCIPEFPYMRCSLHTDVKLEDWPWAEGVISQEKADGMFTNCDVYSDSIELRSRQGLPMPLEHLGPLTSALHQALEAGYEYHGELLVEHMVAGKWTPQPREVGNGILNRIANGSPVPEGMRVTYSVWDRIPLEAVVAKGKHAEPYKSRFAHLREMLEPKAGQEPSSQPGIARLIPYRIVHSLKEAYQHYAEMLRSGKEGTVIKRPDLTWADSTSRGQVKLKVKFPVELRIKGFNEADVDSKNRATFGSVACESECGRLKVNVTGFSDADRADIHSRREQLIDTIMAVESNDIMEPSKEDGFYSLFLPTCLELRTDKVIADTLEQIQAQLKAAMGLDDIPMVSDVVASEAKPTATRRPRP